MRIDIKENDDFDKNDDPKKSETPNSYKWVVL